MKIGIDFYDTITDSPPHARRFIRAAEDKGHEVVVVSAVRVENVGKLMKDMEMLRIRCSVEPVVFSNYFDIPELKLRACRDLGVDVMIDDLATTCTLLAKEGIDTVHYKSRKSWVGVV